MTDAQRALVEDALPMLAGLAWRVMRGSHSINGLEQGDLVNEGAEALIELAVRYDPTRGPSFKAYATGIVQARMRDALRAADPIGRGRRLNMRRIEDATYELAT